MKMRVLPEALLCSYECVCWLCPFRLWSPALHELSGQNFLGTLLMKDSRGLKRTGDLEPPLYLPVPLLPEACDLV